MKKRSMHILIQVFLLLTLLILISYGLVTNDFLESKGLLFISIIIILAIFIYLHYQYTQIYTSMKKELARNSKIMNTMLGLAQSTSIITNQQQFFDMLLEKAVHVVEGADKGSLILIDENENLNYVSAVGFDLEKLKQIHFKLEDTILWRECNGNILDTVIIHNTKDFNNDNLDKFAFDLLIDVGTKDIQTTISSPIFIDGKLYGMINIDSIKKEPFTQQDVALIKYFSFEASKVIKLFITINKMIKYARYDYLTDILNRQYFEELFGDVLLKDADRLQLSLLSIDINDLKYVNDRFGHVYGDKILIQFSNTIKKFLSSEDLFARYGGDEFVIVLFNKDREQIIEWIEGILTDLENNPININNHKIIITFSYGIANYPIEGHDIKDLFANADKNMYFQKRQFKKKRMN